MPESCVPNIGPRERLRRVVFGVVSLAAAPALLVTLVLLDAGRAWRLLLAIPLWGAALGFLQYREKT